MRLEARMVSATVLKLVDATFKVGCVDGLRKVVLIPLLLRLKA